MLLLFKVVQHRKCKMLKCTTRLTDCNTVGRWLAKYSANMTTTRQKKLQEDTRFRVLSLLESQPEINQRNMAKALGISLGGVNYCLRALVEKGLIKVHNFQANENKLGYVYLLTPHGLAEKFSLTASFLQRKQQEYVALKAEIEALQKTVAGLDSGQ
jgi:EPS-associated MarR family transcriptional regulator